MICWNIFNSSRLVFQQSVWINSDRTRTTDYGSEQNNHAGFEKVLYLQKICNAGWWEKNPSSITYVTTSLVWHQQFMSKLRTMIHESINQTQHWSFIPMIQTCFFLWTWVSFHDFFPQFSSIWKQGTLTMPMRSISCRSGLLFAATSSMADFNSSVRWEEKMPPKKAGFFWCKWKKHI